MLNQRGLAFLLTWHWQECTAHFMYLQALSANECSPQVNDSGSVGGRQPQIAKKPTLTPFRGSKLAFL